MSAKTILGLPRQVFFTLAALAAVTLGLTQWPKYAEVRTTATLEKYRAAVAAFTPGPGTVIDRTGTACGPGGSVRGPDLCLTSTGTPRELLEGVRTSLATGDVVLSPGCTPNPALAELASPGVAEFRTELCTASAQRAGVSLAVYATDGALLPGTPTPRSWATIHLAGDPDAATALAGADVRVTDAELAELIPAGFGQTPETEPSASSASRRSDLIPPAAMPMAQASEELASFLAGRGFRVERTCGNKPCRLVATRSDADGHELFAVAVPGESTLGYRLAARDA